MEETQGCQSIFFDRLSSYSVFSLTDPKSFGLDLILYNFTYIDLCSWNDQAGTDEEDDGEMDGGEEKPTKKTKKPEVKSKVGTVQDPNVNHKCMPFARWTYLSGLC